MSASSPQRLGLILDFLDHGNGNGISVGISHLHMTWNKIIMKLTTTVWSYIMLHPELRMAVKLKDADQSSHKNIKDSQGQWKFRGIWLTMTRELKAGWNRSCVTDSHDLSYSNRDFRLDSILLSQTRGDWPRLPNFEPCSAECQFGTTSDRLCLDPSSCQQGRARIQLMILMQTGLGLNLHD